jgi:NADH-quinone oxidoreductase subunit N
VDINYTALAPEIVLSLTGILIMISVPYLPGKGQIRLGYGALLGIGAAFILLTSEWDQTGLAFFQMIFQDDFGHFCKLLFLFSSGAVILVSMTYLEQEKLPPGEFFCLLLFGTVGMCLMATSADLIMTFLGLEVLSISTYVLVGFKARDKKSNESAIKYFLLGAFSTAFLLYGVAFIYGVAGSTNYLRIAETIRTSQDVPPTLLLGLGLMMVGFGFKAALAPFQVWTPDVYEGAPVPITAHLAVASKAAAFMALLRILYQVLPDLSPHWQAILWISAAVTMLIGNVAALAQTNIKRMLAYSSIAHAGYLLVGLTAHNHLGAQSILFYLMAYALMTLGAFAVVQVFGRQNEAHVDIHDYAGMGYRYPFLGITLSIFLISLAGIPTTAGFMGKLFLFAAAVESRMYWLVVIALITSAIGLYYYLRIIVFMYMHESDDSSTAIDVPMPIRFVIAVMVAGTLYLGMLPGVFLQMARKAVSF